MKRKYIIIIAVNALSLILFGIFSFAAYRLRGSLTEQHTADRWETGEIPCAQVSVFTEEKNAWDINQIFTARVDIDKKLAENSVKSEISGARLWADAFSAAEEKVTAASGRTSAEARLIAAGGDFYLFHPYEMLSGGWFSDDDLMQDRAVIDDVLAWQLYGSSDAAGMPITIDGKFFQVAGVYKRSENANIEKVYGTSPRIFVSYKGWGDGVVFTCYEACLPSLVTGQGAGILSEVFSAENTPGIKLVENSSRYEFQQRFGMIRDFGMRSVVDSAVAYPYWENAARITEDKSALLLVLQGVFLIPPVCTVLYLLCLLIKNRKKIFRKAWDGIKSLWKKIPRKKNTA